MTGGLEAGPRGSVRVVHVCKVKGIAGAERHLLYLLPALAQRGLDVRLLVLDDRDRTAAAFCAAAQRAGIPTETVRAQSHVDPTLTRRIAARLVETGPDLVHTHLLHADLYGLAAAKRAGIAATVSSRHDNNPFRRGLLLRWLTNRAMRGARRIVAISDAVAQFAREVEGADEKAIVTIHYGLNIPVVSVSARTTARAALGCGDGQQVIGFVGRLIPQKGVDVLIDAFARIHATRPDARLAILGHGPLRADLEAQADRLGTGRCVTFTGWIESALDAMPAFDVVVVPSRWEGLGLVALEALACARPVVATNVDALPEIVRDRETGLLVPSEDPIALAAAVDEALARPAWASGLGEAGRDRVRRAFSVDRMVDATLKVYGDVLAETRRGRL